MLWKKIKRRKCWYTTFPIRYLLIKQEWWSICLSGTVIYSVSTWNSVGFFMALRTDLNIVFNRYKTACRSGLTMFTFHYYSLLLIEWIILHGWKLVHCMGLWYNIKTNIFFLYSNVSTLFLQGMSWEKQSQIFH